MAKPEFHPRRHIFRGHASGVSAHIRRPEDRLLPVQGCSSLPVTGGLSESTVGPTKLDKWVSFDSVSTRAHGDYVDAKKGVATTRGEIAFDAVPTVTRVNVDIQGVAILARVHVAHIALGLVSHSAAYKQQPRIRVEGNLLEGVRIDDSRLIITLAEEFYQECDTKDKLAARYAAGLSPEEAGLFLPSVVGAEGSNGFPEADGIVKCTIVREIRWDGEPHPTATIDGNVVHLPNFGKIYFGELYITSDSRRLTMVRFQLGSDDGGEVVAGDGESSPGIWPPGA